MKGNLFKKYLIILLFFLLLTPNIFLSSNKASDINLDDPTDKTYTKPKDYNELVTWYQNLESEYPGYIEVFKANEMYSTGKIAGGYDDYYVRITNESLGFHKPEVLFLGSPHGDETVGTISLFWFTDWLMRKAFTNEECNDYSKEWLRWLIDNREIYFEVSHNPYGFDHNKREDQHGWDLNRESDFNGASSAGGIWGSCSGKTLHNFIDKHQIRVGCDFHGGTRMLLYPFWEAHSSVKGTSKISGKSYTSAPPDFYFYDAAGLRLGSYIGNPSGDGNFNKNNVGTVKELIWYEGRGDLASWGYAADVTENPKEDKYVEGNYPGTGALWLTPEMSYTKNPSQNTFGGDDEPGFGWEIRRFVLHQTDLAQPYTRWQSGTQENNSYASKNDELLFRWQVNGSLVVDNTNIQWGTNPDPINNPEHQTTENKENEGKYLGGTGWDDASDGKTDGVTYEETIKIDETGDYYFVAKAKVDQVYADVFESSEYGDKSYLRIIKERTDPNYREEIQGTDGLELINGQLWWYSPIIHVKVVNSMEPSLSYSPESYEIGNIKKGDKVSTSFEIWNEGVEELEYQLSSNEEWLFFNPSSGTSNGEHDNITVEIDTTDLSDGLYEGCIEIASNGGNKLFNVSMEVFSDSILSISPESHDFGKISKDKKIETTLKQHLK